MVIVVMRARIYKPYLISFMAGLVMSSLFQNCSNKGALDLESLAVLVHTVQAPYVIDAGSSEAASELGYDTFVEDSEQGTVFQFTGNGAAISTVRIKVDLNKKYRISGKFKSVGSTLSRIYYGVATYRKNGAFIESWESTRTGFATQIESVTATTITTQNELMGWHTGAVSSYYKAIGFYFDGDINRLPDYVLTNWGDGSAAEAAGTYSTATGKAIQLNIPLPLEVALQITSQTRIANHYAGGSYTYTAAGNNEVSTSWQEFSGTISGFDMANSPNRFRPETDHVSILLLANYSQDNTAVLLVDDLKFEIIP